MVYTDLKSRFDASIGINAPTEKMLLIDLSAVPQSYERWEIAEILWVPTEANHSDALIKLDLLYDIMEQNELTVKDSYWVERKAAKTVRLNYQLIAEFQALHGVHDLEDL